MKRITAIIITLAMALCFIACTGAKENGGDHPAETQDPASAADKITAEPTAAPDVIYAEIIKQKIDEYGVGKVGAHAWDDSLRQLRGLAIVRLIDFDGDGTEELLLGCNKGEEFEPAVELWTIKDGAAVQLEGDFTVTDRTAIYLDTAAYEGKNYIVSGWYYSAFEEKLSFITVENGELTTAYELYESVDANEPANSVFTINGENVTEEQYAAKQAELLAEKKSVSFVGYDMEWPLMEEAAAETERVLAEFGVNIGD